MRPYSTQGREAAVGNSAAERGRKGRTFPEVKQLRREPEDEWMDLSLEKRHTGVD